MLKASLVEKLLQIFEDQSNKAFAIFGFMEVFVKVLLGDSSASFLVLFSSLNILGFAKVLN